MSRIITYVFILLLISLALVENSSGQLNMENTKRMTEIKLFKAHLEVNKPILVRTTRKVFNKIQKDSITGKLVIIESASTNNINDVLDELNVQINTPIEHAQDLTDLSFEDLGFKRQKTNGIFIGGFQQREQNELSMVLLEIFLNKCLQFHTEGTLCVVFVDS